MFFHVALVLLHPSPIFTTLTYFPRPSYIHGYAGTTLCSDTRTRLPPPHDLHNHTYHSHTHFPTATNQYFYHLEHPLPFLRYLCLDKPSSAYGFTAFFRTGWKMPLCKFNFSQLPLGGSKLEWRYHVYGERFGCVNACGVHFLTVIAQCTFGEHSAN